MIKKYNSKYICGMRGYSLIELILAVSLSIIIMSILLSVLNITQKSLNITYKQNLTDTKIISAIEYIKDEIRSCHYYIEKNGKYYFVVDEGNNYRYINFVKNGRDIKRKVSNQKTLVKNKEIYFEGNNILLENCDDFNIEITDNLVRISIKFKNQSFDETLAMRAKKYEKK